MACYICYINLTHNLYLYIYIYTQMYVYIYIYVIVEIGREVQMMQTMFECGSKDSKASPRTLKSVAAMEKQQ